jgi:hypothetical protein
MEPIFEFEAGDGRNKPLQIYVDDEIRIDYDFQNTANEIVSYSLTIRRSTGRFIERFKTPNAPGSEDSGTCLFQK